MALALTAEALWAEGYQVNTLSARQLGMGHTGTALKLGAESMMFNPAGLAFSDKTLDLFGTFTATKASVDCTPTEGPNAGKEFHTDNGFSTPLSFNAAFKVYNNLQVGISFYTPYGSGINWTKNWPGAVLNQKVALKIYTLQPTVSYRILPNLSVGAGLMLGWGSVNLDKGLVDPSSLDRLLAVMAMTGQSAQMGLDPSYRFGNTTPASVNLKGKSEVSFGFNVGAMWDITDNITVGASYRSKMMMKVKCGDASVEYANELARGLLEQYLGIINTANFTAEMPAPYLFSVGASWRPIKRLLLTAEAQLTGWKAYKKLTVDFLDDKLTDYDQTLPKHYKNSWAYRIGAEFAMTNRLDLRAGFVVDTTPVNKNYYNPETPGMTKLSPSVGLSFRPISKLSIDFGFQYVHGLGMDNAKGPYEDFIAKNMPALGLPAEKTFTADYKCRAFVPSIGLNYAF